MPTPSENQSPPAAMNLTFTYAEGELSGPWFRAYKAVKRKLQRGGLNVRVELLPLTELDPHVDVLVLPTSLSHRAPVSVAVGEAVIAPVDKGEKELDRLVERLLADGALRVGQPSRTFALHHGFRPLRGRGRVEE
jgi:hypothetical protein